MSLTGRVIETTGTWHKVLLSDGEIISARLLGKLKLLKDNSTNPIAVGDRVVIEKNIDNTASISEIQKRDNYIIRQSPRKKHQKHVIAANIDQACIMVTVSGPRTSLGFIDRFLVACESFHIPAFIVINKIDQYNAKDLDSADYWKAMYQSIGYEVFLISTQQQIGLDKVREKLKNKTSLIGGHSGVGKSTLVNALNPSLNIRTNEISKKFNKGKHTTTYAQMHKLFENTFFIDTPGIKEFGLLGIEPEELSGYFKEMRERTNQCKFANCCHENEPGCAIINAVENAQISPDRYTNYLNMLETVRAINHWERK